MIHYLGMQTEGKFIQSWQTIKFLVISDTVTQASSGKVHELLSCILCVNLQGSEQVLFHST